MIYIHQRKIYSRNYTINKSLPNKSFCHFIARKEALFIFGVAASSDAILEPMGFIVFTSVFSVVDKHTDNHKKTERETDGKTDNQTDRRHTEKQRGKEEDGEAD